MNARQLCLATVAAAAANAAASAQVVDFVITLDGFQETDAVSTDGVGMGTASLDSESNLFAWEITFEGLSSAQTGAHFHGPAPECMNAPVIIPLSLGSPIAGKQVVTEEQAQQILDGLWYVNIHSEDHPPGEIRGQVMPGPVEDPIPEPIAASPVHVVLEEVLTGITAPLWATASANDGRLFVVDQAGTVWRVELATGVADAFLDVSDRLVPLGAFGPGSFDERGLLGMAFHPDYARNGLLYTYTSEPARAEPDFSTIPAGAEPNHQTVIVEWTVPDPADPDAGPDPGSAREVMRIDQPQFNHNAGAIAFGPDGMLYIALGDGGGADDHDGQPSGGMPMIGHGCNGNGQDLSNPLGAILRIDPAVEDGWAVPADNPFVGREGLDEIYAYGLRNPYRFSFDRASGELWAADVGQRAIEEINIIEAGGNYGWNHKEGTFFFARNGVENGYATDHPVAVPADLIDPVAEYDHDEGIAVVGGFVYRGARLAALHGRYVFGEFAVTFSNDGRLLHLDDDLEVLELQLAGGDELGVSVLGFGEDGAGEIYLLTNETGTPFGTTGAVWRIAARAGDADADGTVGEADLDLVLERYGPCPEPGEPCFGDLDGNGAVDVDDLIAVLLNWDAKPSSRAESLAARLLGPRSEGESGRSFAP